MGHSVATYEAWRNLNVMFFDRVRDMGDKPFVWDKRSGLFQPMSWNKVREQVSQLSRGLRALGVQPGDRVVLVSENRPEWLIAEIAIMCAGAIAVPAYTTNTPFDHKHIVNNVRARAAIVSTKKLAANLLPAVHEVNSCKFVVCMEAPDVSQRIGSVEIHLWNDLLKNGAALPDDVESLAGRAARTDTAVIIHTSGTGGAPRGVMLSHGAIITNCMGAYDLLKSDIGYGVESFLCFLPLSHAYEHMAGQWVPISIAAQIYYAEGIDTLVANMAECKPTIMTAVPRLYEVMHQRVQKAMANTKGLKKKLFDQALALGKQKYEKPGTLTFGQKIMDFICDRLVRKKVQGRFGGNLKFFVSGGAPLNYDIGLFFTALNVKLLQGYGQTEAAPLISCNPIRGAKLHTVGPPVRGVEARIAEDGEICVRGEMMMQGYYGDPDSTKQVIRDGWLCTGDIGLIDKDGHIQITDRKKDIIVNSGGDNVSPQRVEGFLTLQPEIAQAMVYGDKRPHLVAVIVPDPDLIRSWATQHGKPAQLAAICQDTGFHDVISKAVERVNQELSQVERVRRFVIARDDFTTDNEMLTPSMKIRRHVIKKEYAAALEDLYGGRKAG
ncbi:MAG: long-chain fatty acid--CoA ligase [Alphaproteobacteria bacterium]